MLSTFFSRSDNRKPLFQEAFEGPEKVSQEVGGDQCGCCSHSQAGLASNSELNTKKADLCRVTLEQQWRSSRDVSESVNMGAVLQIEQMFSVHQRLKCRLAVLEGF